MRILQYLFGVIAYARHCSRWVYLVLFIALSGTLLEFAALSVLVPLTQHINHAHPSVIARYWIGLLSSTGVVPDTKIWFELFLGLILLRILLEFVCSVLTSSVSRDVTASLSSGAFRKFVVETPLLEIQRHKIGHFIAIAGDEAMRAGQIFLYFVQLLVASLSVLVTIAAMLVFSFSFAVGVAIFVAITGVAVLHSTRKVYRLGAVVKTESRIATSTFLDGLNGLRSVRSIGGERYVVAQYTEQIRKYNRTLFKVEFTTHAQKSLPGLILLLLVLAMILLLSSENLARFDLASALAGMILLLRFFPAAGACLNNGMKLLADLRASHDVVSVATAATLQPAGAPRLLGGSVRSIEVSDLNYRYDAGTAVIAGLSYAFKAGSSYAICGPSGSGKSTLVDLILGLINDTGASICINGIPLNELNQQDYRKRVVLVEQQSRIFNDTVRNNIVFGLAASEHEIADAASLAGFAPVLNELPHGLDTMLDYQGTNLSGGQRQRLGIARALLRNPDVLVLDESLSALDVPTRNAVLASILSHFRDRIVIVVTHDPSVQAQVDHTLFLRSSLPEQQSRAGTG
jgi:ABC-type bacteriocin/lantibiotic exporter with double-glycine peptidase domain